MQVKLGRTATPDTTKTVVMVGPAEPGAPQLPRFYAGREVLITGATGFMGKVLLERLLSQCPEVGRLHLLIRDKRGESAHKRLAHLKQSQVFDNIRAHHPHQLDKLAVVSGDATLPQLGLDDYTIAQLREVSLVFHNAATVKFWEPLRVAVSQNVTSAVNVMDLCDKLPALEALVHVSTAFTNAELQDVEERVYEMGVQPRDLLEVLDALTPETIDQLTPKLIHPKPNTYVFTKALAEVVIAQRQNRKYSVTIFRPSIVISAHRAPFPGWIEGLSGATGVVVGAGQGVLRVFHIKNDAKADVVPVDVAIDNMLAVGWETATDRPVETRVYYCGSEEHTLLWTDIRAEILRSGAVYPFDNVLYYPFAFGFQNRYVYKMLEILMQTIPLCTADYLMTLFGIKQPVSLIKIARRLSAMSHALGTITCHEWRFSYDNMRRLRERLQKTDGHLFYLDIRAVNWQEHISNYHRGARRYLLRQEDTGLPRARRHMNRLRRMHYVVCALCLALILYKFTTTLMPKLSSFTSYNT
ncbi:unnamed protein product [Arctia plantaginis]|uniref:Fatty acyl-CoA reductase n=1 Tax=Arctia plantaginis TaxID=874455 RepID=A0A8S1B2U7_ARCPL|nr:unnamed protein product [Arctia plantaginis]